MDRGAWRATVRGVAGVGQDLATKPPLLLHSKIFYRDFGGPVVKTLCSTAGGVGSVPGRGTKIPHAMQCSRKREIT